MDFGNICEAVKEERTMSANVEELINLSIGVKYDNLRAAYNAAAARFISE
jgi:hypothetical protein